ncbi:MAG: hypothetical protein AB8C84_10805 [Oligoflexales bacterium]
MFRLFGFLFVFSVPSFLFSSPEGSDEWLQEALSNKGAYLEVHGLTHDRDHAVVTWRSSIEFFVYRHFPMIAINEDVKDVVKTLQRHDSIRVWGFIKMSSAGQLHLKVQRLVVEKRYDNLRQRSVVDLNLPQKIQARVHFHNEKVLVVDWGKTTFPIIVPQGKLFWRNDVVEVLVEKKKWPKYPSHFKALEFPEVVESAQHFHQVHKHVEGRLVRYPKSPQIKFDVYAVEWVSPQTRWPRLLTILPENMDDFFTVHQKLETLWQGSESIVEWEGNHEVSSHMIQVAGKLQVQDPEQANIQVIVTSCDDIQELEPE